MTVRAWSQGSFIEITQTTRASGMTSTHHWSLTKAEATSLHNKLGKLLKGVNKR